MARTGTHHFKTLQAAVRYYKPYGSDKEDVEKMITDGSICIGPPTVLKTERLLLDSNDRYLIEELVWYIAAYRGHTEDFLAASEEEAKGMMIKKHKVPKAKRYMVLATLLNKKAKK